MASRTLIGCFVSSISCFHLIGSEAISFQLARFSFCRYLKVLAIYHIQSRLLDFEVLGLLLKIFLTLSFSYLSIIYYNTFNVVVPSYFLYSILLFILYRPIFYHRSDIKLSFEKYSAFYSCSIY